MPNDAAAAVVSLFAEMAESLESTLDPDSRKALLDDIHRRVHSPQARELLSPEAYDATRQLEGLFRFVVMATLGRELD